MRKNLLLIVITLVVFLTNIGSVVCSADPVEIIVDTSAKYGSWTVSTNGTPEVTFWGTNYYHSGNVASIPADPKTATWTPDIPVSGYYYIYMFWAENANRPDAAPLEIKHVGGLDNSKTVNQQVNGGQWNLIGRYKLSEGMDNYVKIIASDLGYTVADAVKFVLDQDAILEASQAKWEIIDDNNNLQLIQNLTAGKIRFTVNIENLTNDVEPKEATLVLLMFNGNQMQGIKVVSDFIESNESKDIFEEIEISSNINFSQYTLKAFVIERLGNLSSISVENELLPTM